MGAVLIATGTAAITFGISEAPRFGIGDGRTVASLATGAALVGLLVRRCRRVPAPLLNLRLLLRHPDRIGLCYPVLIAAAVVGLPSSELSAATAVSQCARQIGAAVGIAVAVAVLGPADLPSLARLHAAWIVAAGFSALAAITAADMQAR
jgi:hypothetical protein